MHVSLDIAGLSQTRCFSEKHRLQGFFYQHFRKKSSNVFSCAGILQYIPLTPGLKTHLRRYTLLLRK